MKLRERIEIDAPPDAVWSLLGDPGRWAEFHPKIGAVEHLSGAGPGPDAWYRIDYGMRNRTMPHRARITEWIPRQAIRIESVLEASDGRHGGPAHVAIEYTLRPRRGKTRVEESIRVDDPRLPRWVGLLASLLHRFGTPRGLTALGSLRRRLETWST